MIGSTDSHTALATAEEDNFFGKMTQVEPSAARWSKVWAKDNTREANFDAIKRREVYATTGPRITVRVFGGWDFTGSEADAMDLSSVGYARGVPMGGELRVAPAGKSPTLLIAAMRDPIGANLDRVQVVKGWVDPGGGAHERVYTSPIWYTP